MHHTLNFLMLYRTKYLNDTIPILHATHLHRKRRKIKHHILENSSPSPQIKS